jgi:hypothetical protein
MATERIIPITVLNSPHNNNYEGNDNRTTTTTMASTNKRPLSPNNNNIDPDSKSLLVTLDDGTTTQTQGSVRQLNSEISKVANMASTTQHQQPDPQLSIQEIGMDRTEQQQPKVRVVPIRLVDGKVINREADETIQIKAEFTNYTHQEFNDTNINDPEIPRMDNNAATDKDEQPSSAAAKEAAAAAERIVPIRLADTGETIMPTFTKLEDPQPPDWSTFSKKNKAKEREVPLNVHPRPPAGDESKDERGRERAKASHQHHHGGVGGRASSNGKKNTVRFDLNESEEKTTSSSTEKRSSSVETYHRKQTTTTTSSKPPTMPRATARPPNREAAAAQPRWRPASAERPSSTTPMSPNTERTLQEIDRDINQIWKELQELEKLPNGNVPSAAATTQRSRTPPRSASANSNLPVTPVRVRASYTATPMSASPLRKYSASNGNSTTTNNEAKVTFSPLTASVSSGTPSSQRRTIWDTESTPSSNPPTPLMSKKLPDPPEQSSGGGEPTAADAAAVSAGFMPRRPQEPTRPGNVHPSWRSNSAPRPAAATTTTTPVMMGRLPPVPPHMRPQPLKLAPMARDESFYDLDSKSPSNASCYDNQLDPNFKGFPYIDGAPNKRRSSSPLKGDPNNFSVLVDKSTQTAVDDKHKSKDACVIL